MDKRLKFNKDVLIIPSKKGCSKIKIIPIENRKKNLIISFRKNDNGYSKIEKFKTDFMEYITNKRYETTDIKTIALLLELFIKWRRV
ncbi:hypothetical protein [Streptococcus acidominimus]|uniref:Uncharacterized protein n=1 Tax=Streptococcus acidominimus TaxID=1326 RepID=A0A4Y9FKK1_STRAI|nr:hypothetical protein [Streptococcus acidominimus]MBF0819675.1 hypothetical protein [Streptococcus acidominimus]MBF0838472.1 hypothetical protein [Streptococcus acidominimus]MBF0847302.1 hypothetical protein [Streptococcus danieliae]TFU29586.1 hypothetical protein E4U01_09470 [Streptococcus acidominimus]